MNNGNERKIKNIIFDLDGTLVHVRPHRANYIRDFLEDKGIHMSEAQVRVAGRWSSEFWIDKGSWELVPDWDDRDSRLLFWRSYLEYYYKILEAPEGSLDSMFEELALLLVDDKREVFLMDDINIVLRDLKTAGYRMGVLSNRESPIAPVVEKYALSGYFRCIYSAGELESFKPDKIIFEKYLEIFGGAPQETMYVGDNYWLDGLGARGAGLSPVILDVFDWYDNIDMPRISTMSELVHHLA